MFHMTVPSWISCNIEVHMISSVFFFLYILNVIELSTSVGNPPLHPPDSAYRICYKMANYGRISDFKMSMEAS